MIHGRVLGPAAAGAAAYVLLGAQLAALGPALAEWMRDFGVGPAVVGTVFTASAVGSVTATLAYAPAVHRFGLRSVLAAGAALVAGGLAGAAGAPSPAPLLVAFAVSGAGLGLLDSGVNHLFVRLFPGMRAVALNGVHLFFALGAAGAPVAVAALMPLWGWRPIFAALAAAALAVAVAFAATGPAGPRDESGGPVARHLSGRLAAALAAPAAAMALYVGVEVTVSGWAFSFLAGEAGASALLAGAGSSIFWAGLAAGRLLLGPAVERAGYRAALVAASALSGAALLAAALPVRPGVAAALLGLSGLGMSVVFPTLVAHASTLVPSGDTATAAAAAAMLLSASAGSMSLPALAGVAAGRIGLRPVMAAMGVLLPAGFLALLAPRRDAGRRAAHDSVRTSSEPVCRTRSSPALKAAAPTALQAAEAAASRAMSAPLPSAASEGLQAAPEEHRDRRIASSQ